MDTQTVLAFAIILNISILAGCALIALAILGRQSMLIPQPAPATRQRTKARFIALTGVPEYLIWQRVQPLLEHGWRFHFKQEHGVGIFTVVLIRECAA